MPLAPIMPHCGSSPRVWGTFYREFFARMRMAVHPHVCGEHDLLAFQKWRYLRFIPTCVGNILLFIENFFHLAVHPHVCGEH